MLNLPCTNPECKSNGQVHPNCKCYGQMAKGGEISHFCEMENPHEKDCEYFAEGGEATAPKWDDTEEPNIPMWNEDVQNAAQAEPKWDSTEEVTEPTWEDTEDKHGTKTQKALTALEGAAQGFAGPLATAGELGVSKLLSSLPESTGLSELATTPEDILARQEANPGTHLAGQAAGLGAGLVTGTGIAGAATKIASKIAPVATTALGKLGSAALNGFISNGIIQGGDEISKNLLGQHPDPSDTVGAVLAAGSVGALTGGLFHGTGKVISMAGESKLGNSVKSMLSGIETGAKGLNPEEVLKLGGDALNPAAFNIGVKFYKKGVDQLVDKTAGAVAGTGGYLAGSYPGAYLAEKYLSGPIAKFLHVPISKASKYVTPAVVKVLSDNPDSTNLAGKLYGAINLGNAADSGLQKMNKGIEGLFKVSGQKGINTLFLEHEKNKRQNRKDLEEYLDNGGANEEINQSIQNSNQEVPPFSFAQGGEVKTKAAPDINGMAENHNVLETHFPEQNIGMIMARSRISNYLTSLKPQTDSPGLAFDRAPDTRDQKRSYNKALDIAVNPLSILNKVQMGTIEPEDIKHFNALHPEVSGLLNKKLTESIIKAQVAGKRPSYSVRQGMSMILGTPLSSEMTPSYIQAAQATFQNKKNQQQQAMGGGPGSKKALAKMGNRYLTSTQAEQTEAQTPGV